MEEVAKDEGKVGDAELITNVYNTYEGSDGTGTDSKALDNAEFEDLMAQLGMEDILEDEPELVVVRLVTIRDELQKMDLNPDLGKEVHDKLWEALCEFEDYFASSFGDLDATLLTKCRTELKLGSFQKNALVEAIQLPGAWIIDQQLTKLSEAGFILSWDTCEWLSAIEIAPKEGPDGGNLHSCIVYGALNDATVDGKHPLPNVDELMDNLAGFQHCSVFDSFSGYRSMKMDERSVPLTSFLTPKVIAACTVMPFGFKNVPPVYMCVVYRAMSGLERTGAFVDDTVRGSRNQAEISADVPSVLERWRAAKLKLKPRKCEIGYPSVGFVGRILRGSGISMQRDKAQR